MNILKSLKIGNKNKDPNKQINKKSKIETRKLSRKEIITTALKTAVILLITLGFVVFGVLAGAAVGYITTSDPVFDYLKSTEDMLNGRSESTVLLDQNGKEIIRLSSMDNKNIEIVSYDKVPENLKDAFIAIEDKRFESHIGFDFIRTTRSILEVFTTGGASAGGSTITQQLVKNITGDDSNSLPRKIREIWRAMQIEGELSKEQILEYYMNIIFMGHGCYGVQTASKAYLNKSVEELDLAECAFLAGITNNPSIYNPLTVVGLSKCKERQQTILEQMLLQERISQQEYDSALAKEIEINKEYDYTSNNVMSYFVETVIIEVRNELISSEVVSNRTEANNIIYGGGVTIYTTMDSNVQTALDTVYSNIDNFPYNKSNPNLEKDYQVQSSMVVLDPETGYIRGIYGGSGEKTINFGLNRATGINRQPGSTLKPIMIYGPLLDSGKLNLATLKDDSPQYLDSSNVRRVYPNNFDNTFKGPMTVETALAESNNVIPALLFRDNMEFCLEALNKVGIDRLDAKYISTALGGLSQGTNPLEIAAAYVPYANDGFYYETTSFTKVVDKNGEALLDHTSDSEGKWDAKLICNNETTPYLMTEAMKQVITDGTAKGKIDIKDSQGGKVEAAGKTGTTNDYMDSWFVGYTPSFVAATWYGFDDNQQLIGDEQKQSVVIWNAVMSEIHKNMEPVSFKQNDKLVSRNICKYSGLLAIEACKSDPRGNQTQTVYFSESDAGIPTKNCDCHINLKLCSVSKGVAHEGCTSTYTEYIVTNRAFSFSPAYNDTPRPKDLEVLKNKPAECTVHSKEKPQTSDIPVTSEGPGTTPTPTTSGPTPTPTTDTPDISSATPDPSQVTPEPTETPAASESPVG